MAPGVSGHKSCWEGGKADRGQSPDRTGQGEPSWSYQREDLANWKAFASRHWLEKKRTSRGRRRRKRKTQRSSTTLVVSIFQLRKEGK